MELSGEEKKLQALFSELKTAEEETAPRFARVWNGATPGARRALVFNPAFVVVTALLVCAVVSFAVWSRYRQQTEPAVVRVETPAAPASHPSRAVIPQHDQTAGTGAHHEQDGGVRWGLALSTHAIADQASAAAESLKC